MSWDAAIHGRLVIPSDRREAWLDAELDWHAVDGHEVWDGYVGGETVRDIVENVLDDGLEFVEVEWEGDEIRVQSFQTKDGFNETVIGFAAAWAASAPFGGQGELIGMGMLTASFGYRLTVKKGKAKFSSVPEREVGKLDNHPDAKAIEQRVMAIGDALAQEYLAAPKKASKTKASTKKASKTKASKTKASKKKASKTKASKKKAPANKKAANKKAK
ncbi:hypothetical protein ACNOYE_28965 [Nannocystaceae bacterium ST9]